MKALPAPFVVCLSVLGAVAALAAEMPGSGIEVVTANQRAFIETDEGGWKTEWISERQGLAVTCETEVPERFRAVGLLHVWSLRTGKALRTIRCPATVQVLDGNGDSPVVAVAGGPYNKNSEDPPFVWLVNLLTGEVAHKLAIWPKVRHTPATMNVGGRMVPMPGQSPEMLPDIRTGGLSADGRKLILIFSSDTAATYDLKNPSAAPESISREAGLRMLRTPNLRALPNWLSGIGASDGRLVLNLSQAGPGTWRTDTGGQLLDLNPGGFPAMMWTAAPSGNVILSIRPGKAGPHLIWDLEKLEIVEWQEPRILPYCTPAFTAGGRVFRYARLGARDQVEFVSRDWRSAAERVDFTADALRRDMTMPIRGKKTEFSWAQVDAVFSDDARALAVLSGGTASVLTWPGDTLTAPAVTKTRLPAYELAGVSPDGSALFHTPPRKDGQEAFACRIWMNGKPPVPAIDGITSVGHSPYFNFQSYPGMSGSVLSYRVVGQSLGPYGFGLAVRQKADGKWTPWPEEQMTGLLGACFVRPRAGGEVIVAWFDSALRTYDPKTGRLLAEITRSDLWRSTDRRLAGPTAGRVLLPLQGGGVQLFDVASDGKFKPVAQLWSPNAASWLAVLPDGRYAVSPNANPPVFFRRGGQLYPVEELDAELNQPAAVAEALGASADVVAEYRNQRTRRLARLRLTDAPVASGNRPALTLKSLSPVIHDQPSLAIEGTVRAAGQAVVALDLYVNDVPVFGRKGSASNCPPQGSAAFRLEVPLVGGNNKVQIAARDAAGVASLRETFQVNRSPTGVQPRRFVLAIGVADYDDDRLDLNYASKDAADVAQGLTEVKGRFRDHRTLVLTDKKARRAGILAAKDFLRQTKAEDEVIVFVSGHGVVNDKGEYFFCAADFRADDRGNGVSFADLEDLFDGIPALTRLLLVDSCHSGELSEDQVRQVQSQLSGTLAAKGVRVRAAGSRVKSTGGPTAPSGAAREVFLDLRRTTGATVLSASGGLEFAMEDQQRKNGLFTHCLLSALASSSTDADQSGEVTASELIRTVGRAVEELTEGQQRPNARFTNLAIDFPVVSARGARPPGRPEDVVRNLVFWSSGMNTPFNPRLLTCFAPTVSYFGKQSTLAAIESEEREYHVRFRMREGRITHFETGRESADGMVTIRYELAFDHGGDMPIAEAERILAQAAKNPASGWRKGGAWTQSPDGRTTHVLLNRSGKSKLEAVVRQFGLEWKIVSLRPVKG